MIKAFKIRIPNTVVLEPGDEVKFIPNKANVFLHTKFIGKSRIDGQCMFKIDKYEGDVPEELYYIFDGETSINYNNQSMYIGEEYPSLINTSEDEKPITINDL